MQFYLPALHHDVLEEIYSGNLLSLPQFYEYMVFQEWYNFTSQYLQPTFHEEYNSWHHNIDIVKDDTRLLDDTLQAYERGYSILEDIQKRLVR